MPESCIESSHEDDIKELNHEDDDDKHGCPIDEDLMADTMKGEDDNASDSTDYDEMDRFKPVLDAIDFEQLPHFAVSIRMQNTHLETQDKSAGTDGTASPMTCKVLYPPLTGSYHILYRLEFDDGVTWMFKVPSTGHEAQFDDLAAKAITSEAMTMRLLKRETSIPVPEVYSFDASLDNAVKCPFIMMEDLKGQPLHELWFQPEASQAALERFRNRVLQQLAVVAVQLSAFTYEHSGSLLFDKAGNINGIGAAKVVDLAAQYKRMCNYDEDEDDSPLFYAKGPMKDPKSFLSFVLERGPPQPQPSKHNQGMHMLLRIFIDWMSYDYSKWGSPFVLAHPDFALQNVLVSDDGTLHGIIDWDGVAAVPRCFGQYPLWLMRDWEPVTYNWDFAASKLHDEFGPPEDSPEKLKCYRTMYAQFVKQCRLTVEGSQETDHTQGFSESDTVPKVSLDIVNPKSLVFRTLALAVEDPMSTTRNMRFIFDEIDRLTAADWDDACSDSESLVSRHHNVECGKESDCAPRVSAGLDEQSCDNSLKDYIEVGVNTDSTQQEHIHGTETGVAGITKNAQLSDHTNHSMATRGGSDDYVQPLRYRIQESLRPVAEFIHQKKGKKPFNATPQPAIVRTFPTGSITPRIRNLFHNHTGIPRNTNNKITGKDTEPQPAIVQQANVEACPNGSVSNRHGWLKNALSTVGLLRETKIKQLEKNGKSHSRLDAARSSEDFKPHGGRIRNACQHAIAVLYKKKTGSSCKDPGPKPAVVKISANEDTKPRSSRVRSILQQTFPCLWKSKSDQHNAHASISPAQTEAILIPAQIEDDKVWDQFRRDLEDVGISTAVVKERHADFMATLQQAAQSKLAQECGSQAVLETPQSTETAEDKGKASLQETTKKEPYDLDLFALYSITNTLADNKLPSEVMVRLKEGFTALVASAS